MVVYSGMFRTRVQIWFQLEFPCNVPNLIKLMRGFFPAISTGFPVSVPTSSAQPCTWEAMSSVVSGTRGQAPSLPLPSQQDGNGGGQGRCARGDWEPLSPVSLMPCLSFSPASLVLYLSLFPSFLCVLVWSESWI